MKKLARWWREFKCRHDWHDYPDSEGVDATTPMHFHEYTCRHCLGKFSI